MASHQDAYLWSIIVDIRYILPKCGENPTMIQIRTHRKVNPLSHPDNTNIEAARHEKVPERHASAITPDLQLQHSKFRTRIQ